MPIYGFHDSEQKVEFEARIKPCSLFPSTKLYEIFIVASFMILGCPVNIKSWPNILEGCENFKEIQ